jgi:DNA-directed RNA polymerase II subunit RPB2
MFSTEVDDEDIEVEPSVNEIKLDDFDSDYFCKVLKDVLVDIPSDFSRAALPLTPEDPGYLLKRYLSSEGFGDFHIEVYNNWISKTLDYTIRSRKIDLDDGRSIVFQNFRPYPPRYTREGKVVLMTPKLARENGATYASDLHIDIVMLSREGEEEDRKTNVCIGSIPTMVRSQWCILAGKTPHELALLGEDPKDPGGYFIIKGAEKVVLSQEMLTTDKILQMVLKKKDGPVSRFTANTMRGTVLVEIAIGKKTPRLRLRFPSMRDKVIPKKGKFGKQPEKEDTEDGKKSKGPRKYRSVNVLRIFRLYGITDLQEIIRIISLFLKPDQKKKCLLKLNSNIMDFTSYADDTSILIYKMGKQELDEADRAKAIKNVLDNDLFPNLNNLPGLDGESVDEYNARITKSKVYMLAIMTARFLEHLAGFRALDDRNSWSNKRIEGAGRMMESLFRNAWRKVLALSYGEANDAKDLSSFVSRIQYKIITESFVDSFNTSKWGVKGQQTKNNVAQTLSRESVIATLSHINTVDVSISRTDTQPEPRLVQPSQFGFIDPLSSPEGDNVGIIKNLSITTKVSLVRKDDQIIRLLVGGGGLKRWVSIHEGEFPEWKGKLMANGKFLGWCDVNRVQAFLLKLRRSSSIACDTNVIVEDDWLYVDMSPSRPIRPLLIVDKDQKLVIDKLGLREAPLQELLSNGAMEYISPWEQEYIKLAMTKQDIEKRVELFQKADEEIRLRKEEMAKLSEPPKAVRTVGRGKATTRGRGRKTPAKAVPVIAPVIETMENTGDSPLELAQKKLETALENRKKLDSNRPYTHCELDPTAILGVSAALIPWPNHNQAPRNTYQVGMGKQAVGVPHNNHLNRFDGASKILISPQRPMVETEMYETVGLDVRGPGQNVNTMFTAWPFTEEDAFGFKKEALQAGMFRTEKYFVYKTVIQHTGEVRDYLQKPKLRVGEKADRYDYIYENEANPKDHNNGLPKLGAYLRQGDCVIGKMQHIGNTNQWRNDSVMLRYGDEGIVDKVLVTSDSKTTVVTVKLRTMRIPRLGDKFSPRNAQKGTIGIIPSEVDLPSNEAGIAPDVITNVAQMPTRMTVSFPLEMLASKYAAMKGIHVNGGAFKPFDMKTMRQTLKKDYGMDEFGYEKLRSGTSGQPLQKPGFQCPVFYQRLRHDVADKIQMRSTGRVNPINHQPYKGRGNKGGLRTGEMERDAFIAHGAAAMLRERLMLVSDGYKTAFCKQCGSFAEFSPTEMDYRECRLCKNTMFGGATIPYAYKWLIQLQAAMGIRLRPEFAFSEEYMVKKYANIGVREVDFEMELMEDTVNDDLVREKPAEDVDYGEIY